MRLEDPLLPAGEFDAFLFDCDGTIADSMALHHEAWLKALSPYGAQFTPKRHEELAGRPTDVIVEILNSEQNLRMPAAEVSNNKEECYLELMSQVEAVPLVRAVIERYQGKVRYAVVSGSPRDSVLRTLSRLGLVEVFPLVIGAGETLRGKPAPDPYLLAAEKLQVPASRCLVFEDAELGIQSAQAARMAWVKFSRDPLGKEIFSFPGQPTDGAPR